MLSSAEIAHHNEVAKLRRLHDVVKQTRQQVAGCMDPEAKNYNPDAAVDDGACEYVFSVSFVPSTWFFPFLRLIPYAPYSLFLSHSLCQVFFPPCDLFPLCVGFPTCVFFPICALQFRRALTLRCTLLSPCALCPLCTLFSRCVVYSWCALSRLYALFPLHALFAWCALFLIGAPDAVSSECRHCCQRLRFTIALSIDLTISTYNTSYYQEGERGRGSEEVRGRRGGQTDRQIDR